MTQRLSTLACAAALVVGLLPMAALAQTGADPGPRVWLKMVGHASKIDSDARVDEGFNNGSPGTTIDIERELNQDDKKLVGNLEFGVRLGTRWRLEVEYLQLRRGGSTTLGRQIRFDGLDFAQGAAATSESRLTYIRVNTGYSFVRDEATELGVAFGGASIDNRLTIRARANAAVPNAGPVELTRSDTVWMPLVGLHGRARLAPGWHFLGRLYVGRMNSSDEEGSILDASALVAWELNPNFRLLAGLRTLDLRAEPKLSGFVFALPVRSEFNTRLTGPVVQGELRF